MVTSWTEISFAKCLIKHEVKRDNQIPAADIQAEGKYPVIDQGKEFVGGYTDESERLICNNLPYVIFGDHTRCFKFVDFPFVLGADGTKILKPNPDLFDAKFFYFALLSLEIPSRGYNRHYKLLKESSVVQPPLPEQRRIAAVLSAVQRAIGQQEELIARTTELKKALMHKLFTEGTRGEPQKETEIGPVPESWDVIRFGDVLVKTQYGLSVRAEETGEYPMLRMTNQIDGKIVPNVLKYVDLNDDDFVKFKVNSGDVLFNRTNSRELVGRTAIFDLKGDYVFASYLIRLQMDRKRLNPYFLCHYFNSDVTQARLKSIATRAVSQSNISATRLKGFKIPLPSLDEQAEIIEHLDFIDAKRDVHQQLRDSITDLFHTLLHQLMTAEIRVDDVDLSELREIGIVVD